VWLFIVAPLVGGALAAAVHWLIFPPSPGSVDTEQAELAEEAADRRSA
jgi:hypothetical protein